MSFTFTSLRWLDQTDGTVMLQHAVYDATSPTKTVLFPKPSTTDPNDPLRWPKHKKHIAFASICAFAFLTNFAIGGLAPAFYLLSIEFDKSMDETSHLLLYPILVLGVFNFFWVPIANMWGKRPVFVFASGLLCACYIWGAVATSFSSLLGSNIIAAIAGSSTEALGAALVNDLYFLHERGGKMGIYMNAIAGGNTLGPLICGFVITNLSWRWYKWIAVILTGLNFLAILLFVPETRYQREEFNEVGVAICPSREKVIAADEKFLWQDSDDGLRHQVSRKTWRMELSLWSGAPNMNLAKMFVRPFPMLLYPSVIYASLCYSISLVITVAVNILNPFVLQAPPYNWSPQINGLINIPGILGNLFGAWAGGNLMDRWCTYRTKKNGGIYEPESRLYMVIIPFMITIAGCIVFGYGVQNALSWVSLFFGYGMVAVALTAIPTITMSYVSDCALPVNSDVLLLVNGLKNIVAFGFLYGVVPWVEEAGYVTSFGALAGVFAGIVGIGAVLLIVYGARARHASAQWKVILECVVGQ
ncbi:MFS general substrate transporter [Clathrospora elynae]|uniref:MFS general substrate transporter n=1 Tax=Clathrospora elynae TaxID=706981 RepID=A0A6A5SIN4_9PLEO|nr:MFS general substrate transporter [Clathrospora elynae]